MGEAHLSVGENVGAVSPRRPGSVSGERVVPAAVCEKGRWNVSLLLPRCFHVPSSISLCCRDVNRCVRCSLSSGCTITAPTVSYSIVRTEQCCCVVFVQHKSLLRNTPTERAEGRGKEPFKFLYVSFLDSPVPHSVSRLFLLIECCPHCSLH